MYKNMDKNTYKNMDKSKKSAKKMKFFALISPSIRIHFWVKKMKKRTQ